MSEENKEQVEEIEDQDVKKPPQESTDATQKSADTAGDPEKGGHEEGEEPAEDDSDDRIDLDEVVESENDFEMKNIIGFIIGFLVLVAGFITLGMGSTSLSPFLIIGGYIIIGVSLII